MALADKEWQEIQKKAFTHWINSILEKKNETLMSIEEEFKTGVKLLIFLEILTVEEVPKYNKIAKHRLHYIENGNIALNYLKSKGVKDVSISAEEIVDGNLKMLLGMCWVLLRHFGKRQTEGDKANGDDNSMSFEDSMLQWAQKELEDYDLDVSSFKTSFNDGKVFLALCNKLYPDVVNYDSLDLSNSLENSNRAFQVAEEKLRVPVLLNATNLAEGKEKDKSVVLYLSLLYNAYNNEMDKRKIAGFSEKKTMSLQEQIKMLDEETVKLKEMKEEMEEKLEVLEKNIEEEVVMMVEMKEKEDEGVVKVQQEKEELKAQRDKLEKEKESIEKENEEMLNNLRKSEKQREKLEEILKGLQKENTNIVTDLQKAMELHLKHLNTWKTHFVKEGKQYTSDTVQQAKLTEIENLDPFKQLTSIVQSLSHESLKLNVLKQEREEREAEEKDALEKSRKIDEEIQKKKKK